jgi:hypothetical protein
MLISRSSSFVNTSFVLFLLLVQTVLGQSSTNGVYGGYVGSDRWFSEMRKTASNQALIQSLGGDRNRREISDDYIELAGQIIFPEGNPFPKGQLPDLRINCLDKSADEVERAPFIDSDGVFYTVLKKGQSYDVSWMYYFGSREKFSTIVMRPDGPKQRKLAIEYRTGSQDTGSRNREKDQPAAVDSNRGRSANSLDFNHYDLSGFPRQPTNFEEQLVLEEIKYAKDPASKARAHEKLARYYEKRGDRKRANDEFEKSEYWQSQ